MVAIIDASSVRIDLRALTRNLWRRGMVRRRRATAMGLLELLTFLVVALQLRALFPLPVPFRWGSWWTVLAIPSCSFCRSKCCSWSRCAAGDATASRGISMVLSLVRSLVTVAWRASTVLNDGSHFWRWAAWTSVRWQGAWGRLTRRSGQSSRWRWWRRWDVGSASMWAIVGVRDAGRLRLLRWLRLVGRGWRLLGLSRLRSELRRLGMVRAGRHMMRLWRR